LPALASQLVDRRVAVIATTSSGAFPAKAATTTIPIVFLASEDPVKLGLVSSLGRPGSNLTGINFFSTELTAKRLELLRELVPTATRVAVLGNPTNPITAGLTLKNLEAAAQAIGLQTKVLNVSTIREIDAAFVTLMSERPDALFVANDPFFVERRVQLAHWATHHKVPATYSGREFVEVGGLISYGANLGDAYRQVGVYVGRILKGEKPADLPVMQSTKFELIINASTARMLGLTVPQTLLVAADEVIE
jgi:putative tryptophan/tyrosine transport system substrate-binding protein